MLARYLGMLLDPDSAATELFLPGPDAARFDERVKGRGAAPPAEWGGCWSAGEPERRVAVALDMSASLAREREGER